MALMIRVKQPSKYSVFVSYLYTSSLSDIAVKIKRPQDILCLNTLYFDSSCLVVQFVCSCGRDRPDH